MLRLCPGSYENGLPLVLNQKTRSHPMANVTMAALTTCSVTIQSGRNEFAKQTITVSTVRRGRQGLPDMQKRAGAI